MDKFRNLLVGLLAALFLLAVPAVPAEADSPNNGAGDIFAGTPTTDGKSIEIKGSRLSSIFGKGTTAAAQGARPHLRSLTADQLQALFDEACVGAGTCDDRRGPGVLNPMIVQQTPAPVDDADPQPARIVSIQDVARYVPVDAELRLEPDGWAVVGVPANFLTAASVHVVRAQLLGEDADVRFTPRLYRWNHGDGTSTTTTSAGATWADLGQDEYTATPTSHVYRAKGRLDVSVTVIWSAEYRLASGPWTAVAGAVSSDSASAPLLVVTERTVLTNG